MVRRKVSWKKKVYNIATKAALNATNGKRITRLENRGGNIAVVQDSILWTTLQEFATPYRFRQILAANFGHDASAASLGNEADKRHNIIDYKRETLIRNMSPHGVYITVYKITPAIHMTVRSQVTDSEIGHQLFIDLLGGWRQLLDDTADVYFDNTPTAVGTLNTMQRRYQIDSKLSHLNLSDSEGFDTKWKVKKMQKILVPSGTSFKLKHFIKKFTYADQTWRGLTQAQQGGAAAGLDTREDPIEGIRGISELYLLKIHGDLGMDSTDEDTTGFLPVDLAFMARESFRTQAITQSANTTGVRVVQDTMEAKELDAPTKSEVIKGDQFA